ncbi:MAG: hypothetical protein ORN49_00615, partial [Rhodobacteraceae bacterium]|nr:hypothetical protein [Paracoccaceae bacterium]
THTSLVRARISDVAAFLPPGIGLLIHRSHWIAAIGIDRIHKKDRQISIVTTDGTFLSVARNRKDVLENWLRANRLVF